MYVYAEASPFSVSESERSWKSLSVLVSGVPARDLDMLER